MTDEDTRSLPAAAQAALRTRAVRAVLGGMTQAHAARVFGVHPNAVNRWIRRYREGGFPGLSARRRGRRGRRVGEQAALTETQQQEAIALVREATPDQLGLPGFLWTREAVAELIARRYGLRLARTTMALPAWVGVQSPEAPAAGLGAAPGRGAPLADHRLSRHLCPGQAGGRGGVVAG
jgi:transposase